MTTAAGRVVCIGGESPGEPASPETVGTKAANLQRLAGLGLPVPPGFAFPTAACLAYFNAGGRWLPELDRMLDEGLEWLEKTTGRGLGAGRAPLVLAVRSGAAVSMPGMMETVLDVGLNETAVHGLIRATGNPRLAWDSYRRLVESFGEVVAGCPPGAFEGLLRRRLATQGLEHPGELDSETLREVASASVELYRELIGEPFPQAPREQLRAAVEAVFRSWLSARAAEYRRLHGLEGLGGTAVTVQTMVFGNAGGTSGAGVAFTRDPSTGERRLYLDFLFNAQGEDVVAGRRSVAPGHRLAEVLPAVWQELERVALRLEEEFLDLQDFELTVEEGRLWLLQTRRGQRTPWAALHIAVDLVREGLIDPATALGRLAGLDLGSIERRVPAAGAETEPLAQAVSAGLGAAVGAVALDPRRARALAEAGNEVILVRDHLGTDDIAGLAVAEGVLAAAGGRTSHAAVVARQMGKVCLVDCDELTLDSERRRIRLGDTTLAEGEVISLDGETGRIYRGRLEVRRERPTEILAEVERWRRESSP
jgi:pyruvate,orthophosphate dikinase